MKKTETGSSKVYEIVALCFEGQKTAGNILSEAKDAGLLEGFDILAQAVIEQDEQGKVHFHEPGMGGLGAAAGAVVGGLLSFIGGPVGLLAWIAGGAVVGGVAGKYLGRPIKKGDLEDIGNALTPDSSAVLLLLEDTYTEAVVKSMSGYNANVLTLTLGDDLSDEIASYTAVAAAPPAA